MLTTPSAPLESPRLLLRAPESNDAAGLLEIYSDDEVTRFLRHPSWKSLDDAHAWLDRAQQRHLDGTAVQLVVVDRTQQKIIGTCVLFAFEASDGHAELGYLLSRPYRGTGLMHEALTAFIDFAFATPTLRRIEAQTDPLNAASGRVLLRLGFTREGLLRQRALIQGQVKDSECYGLLRHEWPKAAPKVAELSRL